MFNFSEIFLIAVALAVSLQWWLDMRQIRHVRSHRNAVPAAFVNQIEDAAHQKAADYTLAKTRLSVVIVAWSTVLLLAWTLGGGLDLLDRTIRNLELSPLITGIVVIVVMSLIGGLLDLPFTLYRTFRLEQRFGFNHTTPKLFIVDLIKGLVIGLILGVPLLWTVLWLMESAGPMWWLYVWGVWFGFSLLMMWIYPRFIAPFFNKFQPLDDAELKQRIEALLQRCGFSSSGVFVMDGSRRSSHGNAYFTGLGSNKRIVFFDTLLKTLSPQQIEAVLAHELGHFRHHHIRKRIATSAIITLAGLALMGWLMQQAWFFLGLGITTPSTYSALILFLLIAPVFTIYFNPIAAYLSRRHEFEADAFASEHSSANELISALVNLYRDNANTLTPDPLYSAFHDSHPPASIRIQHLHKQNVKQI